MGKYEYTNRDISWLSFNLRVLQEAMDKTLPLYERIKFLAIYSNNTEEFYQVRVSYYKQMLRHEREFPKQHFRNVDPARIIKQINEIVTNQQSIFHLIFEEEIIPALRQNNIIVVDGNDKLSEEQISFVSKVFYSDIITSIQPVLLVKKKVRPFMKTGQPYMALEMVSRDSNKKKTAGAVWNNQDPNGSQYRQVCGTARKRWQTLHYVPGRCDHATYRCHFPRLQGQKQLLPETHP